MYYWHYGRKRNLLEWEKTKQKYDFDMFSHLSWLGLIKQFQQYESPISETVFLVILQKPNYRMKVQRV